MILDRIENASMYESISPEIALALDFLRRNDAAQLAEGRHEIDGDRVFAIVQRYKTKPRAEAKWEAHRRYLDIQYVVSGTEWMGYAPLRKELGVSLEYNPEKDYVLYETSGDFLAVSGGMFAIFGPQDVHAPSVASGGPETVQDVCKVVLKCCVSE